MLVPVMLFFPVSKSFSYHFIKGNCYNHGAWIYDRIFENDTPVDVAFIGSSHSLHGINEVGIEKEIVSKTGKEIQISNFGYCQMGRNFQYAVLKDLLKEKQPKLVVIEIAEDESRVSHSSFPFIADTEDILSSHFLNQYYLSDLFKAVVLRWEYYKAKFVFGFENYSINKSNYGYGSSTRIASKSEIEKNKENYKNIIKRDHEGLAGNFLDNYPFYFLNKSVQLLKENNIDFVFLFIPTSNVDIEKSFLNNRYEEISRVYNISPLNFTDIENWMDGSHLNDTGSKKISNQVAAIISEELCL